MTSEDQIKDAFARAKNDIFELREYISSLYYEIEDIKRTLEEIKESNRQTDKQTELQQTQPSSQENPTDKLNELNKQGLEGVKSPISSFSTGNRGVPTDRQTNQQTDKPTENNIKIGFPVDSNSQNQQNNIIKANFNTQTDKGADTLDRIDQISNILSSLDDLKKDIRTQFKRLTAQEMLIFSSIYQLEEEGFTVDYPLLASKLKLSESSIRDYTLKIMKKGIPLQKEKVNNKKITLKIPQNFKKIASLQTILALREL